MRLRILIVLSLLSLVSGCHRDTPAQAPVAAPTPAALEAHSDEFKQQVVKVTDGVWVAIGYGIANSILLEGEDGVVIVDTMETREAAEQVRDAFRKISSKPVKAIVYTHSHPDHIGGAAVFGGPGIPVIAQAEVAANMDKIASQLQPVITRHTQATRVNLERMRANAIEALRRAAAEERPDVDGGNAEAAEDDSNSVLIARLKAYGLGEDLERAKVT